MTPTNPLRRPDGETLRELYWERKLDDVDIAKIYHVTATSVCRWRRKFRIPARTPADANILAWEKGKFNHRKNAMKRPEVVAKMAASQSRRFRNNPDLGRQHGERLRASPRAKAAAQAHSMRMKKHYADHPEARLKIGRDSRERYRIDPQAGVEMSRIKQEHGANPEIRKRISAAKQRVPVEDWVGFVEPIKNRIRKLAIVREAHAKALYRDNYACKMPMPGGQRCGLTGSMMEANHILTVRATVTPDLVARANRGDFSWVVTHPIADPNNLITLCRPHHQQIKFKEHDYQEQFEAYIRSLVALPSNPPKVIGPRDQGYKSKLTRAEVCARIRNGEKPRDIASFAGITIQRVSQIVKEEKRAGRF